MTAACGCDSGSFLPPPPAELVENADDAASGSLPRSAAEAMEPAAAKALEVFLDRRDADEAEVVKTAARTQAGLDMVLLNITILGEKDLPARQVDQVRESLAHHPLAVVVEPAVPPASGLSQVLDEARDEGVPVVLVNRPLAAGEGNAAGRGDPNPVNGASASEPGARPGAAKPANPPPTRPAVLVKAPPFASSAGQLVASALRNAENAHLEPRGGAVIIINTLGDPFIPDRVAAIRTALEAAGVTKISEVSFSKQFEVGSKVLTEKLQADPKIVLVFTVDSLSSLAAREVMNKLVSDRPFIMAGYASEDSYAQSTRMADFAAVATYAPTKVLRKAMSTAVAIAQGRNLPGLIEFPIDVHDSPAESTTAKSPGYMKMKSGKSKKGS
jgi:ABC-type sugar transport system substrate-binding protein